MPYPVKMELRPWRLWPEVFAAIEEHAETWLTERGGIVCYQNGDMWSSRCMDQSFLPARFIAQEDNAMHDAPLWHEGGTGLCSHREQAVDFISVDQYGGDWKKAFAAAFIKEEEKPEPVRKTCGEGKKASPRPRARGKKANGK